MSSPDSWRWRWRSAETSARPIPLAAPRACSRPGGVSSMRDLFDGQPTPSSREGAPSPTPYVSSAVGGPPPEKPRGVGRCAVVAVATSRLSTSGRSRFERPAEAVVPTRPPIVCTSASPSSCSHRPGREGRAVACRCRREVYVGHAVVARESACRLSRSATVRSSVGVGPTIQVTWDIHCG